MISVALDGPAGAGKSTLARKLAEHLGFIYVDTGALYRSIGLKFSMLGADTDLDLDIKKALETTDIAIRFIDGEQRVFLDEEDVSEKIRTPKASMMASAVSAKPEVRAFLLEMQRKLARENNVVMDGRDIGTVVLPNATVKIFLTASAEERAKRRYKELIEKGMEADYNAVYEDMVKRDYADMNREIAPLKQADDAILVDTSTCDLDESLQLLIKTVKEHI